jgi:hypothetical protein
MKPFVGSLPVAERSPGGRLGRVPDLGSFVILIAGTVALAELLGLIETSPLVKFLLPGVAFGTVVGRVMVVWRERGGNELPSGRVRQIETSWTLAGTVVSLLLYAFA